MSFVKHKHRGKVTDKIANVIASRKEDSKKILEDDQEEVKEESDEEIDLSDDELQHDNLRVKQKKGKRAKVDQTIEDVIDKDFFEDAPESDDITSFYQMNLSRPLMKAIGILGYVHPTPIQSATIPVALLGRDICGCAATGTGKTASYMLPTLERLLYKPATNESITRVLVLVPTRELGAQVYQVTKQLCQFTNIDIGMAIGGLDVKAQEAVLRKNPDVVIATPGRLIDHIKNTPSFSLDSIEVSYSIRIIKNSNNMMIYYPCALIHVHLCLIKMIHLDPRFMCETGADIVSSHIFSNCSSKISTQVSYFRF